LTARQKLGAAVAVTVLIIGYLMLVGPTKYDRQHWGYDCPSAARILTSSSFINIDNHIGGNEEAVGEPDGRRVYRACKAAAQRNFGISVLVLVLGSASAVFFGLKAAASVVAPGATPLLEDHSMLRLSAAAELVDKKPETVRKWIAKGWVTVYYLDPEGKHPRLDRDELLAAKNGRRPKKKAPGEAPPSSWEPNESAGRIARGPSYRHCDKCQGVRQGWWVSQENISKFTCGVCNTSSVWTDEQAEVDYGRTMRARLAEQFPDD
jgi:hypothetical protein